MKPKNLKKLVTEMITEIREAGNLSQDELAQLLGYSHRCSVSVLENGKRNINIMRWLNLCNLYEHFIGKPPKKTAHNRL